MKSSFDKNEQTIASEVFSPQLDSYTSGRFKTLLIKMKNTLHSRHVDLIKKEIEVISNEMQNKEDVELLKYKAALSVLIDLTLQGWIFEIEDEKLTLKMDNENIDDKTRIRYRMSAERNAQFKIKTVSQFIQRMERMKNYRGNIISIRNLIGDKNSLINAIDNNERVCDPYIQLVTPNKDELTGYKLSDIWRYFRYTWSIPYKTMPGRNLFYLVRDRMQPYHPIIGIFALGNSVLNLSVRDDEIGWTVDAIKKNMSRKTIDSVFEQIVSETDGKKIKTKIKKPIESLEEFEIRTTEYADIIYPLLESNIDNAINEIYADDLNCNIDMEYPSLEKIDELTNIAKELSEKSFNNKNNEKSPVWQEEARTTLYKRKRSAELAKLFKTKRTFFEVHGESNKEKLYDLLSNEQGRRAINTSLIANRKRKIGSNMMEIVVCGSIPPYNELLGGKLVSILACSPRVIRDYTVKYENQVSEIASRMKGSRVVRDSHLVYLGTTSLYAIGSSQYNRIKVIDNGEKILEYKKIGITEGFGTVFFSKETTTLLSNLLEIVDGGKKINHVFGEGTSPRFRLISRGLKAIGIRAEAFLKHYSPRIVYSMNLAKNTNEFLMGLEDNVDYGFDINDLNEVEDRTQYLIDFWYNRWLTMRLRSVDITDRLNSFNVERFLLGNL